ncbi:MAG: CRISPR-associated ring nuclease Crn3/Csx3 [Thermoproteota archaeon]
MNDAKLSVREEKDYTIVHFEINTITPEVLSSLAPPKVNATKGVVLSGRGPIWLYGYLIHHYHPTKFIATYDPRLGGAVVVESHCPGYKVGDVVRLGEQGCVDMQGDH